MRRGRWVGFGAALLAATCGPALAVTARSWSIASGEAFFEGKLDGTEIDDQGRLRLAPEFRTRWGPSSGVVWAVAPDGEGGAFVGLSGPGRVVHVPARGEAETWYEDPADELVTALASDASGGVWVGLSPSGRVLHLRPGGQTGEAAATGAEFVWSLYRDRDGVLWIGTGSPGRVLTLSGGSEPATRFDAGDDPVRCMTGAAGGGVLAGTGQRGRVVRLGPDGPPFVLLDADEDEIVSLGVDAEGRVFALAAGAAKRPAPHRQETPGPPEAAAATTTVHVTASAEPEETGHPAPTPARPSPAAAAARPGAVLYRLDPDGGTWTIWRSPRENPSAVVVDRDGSPVVATGDQGRILRLDREGRSTRVLRFPSDRVSALAVGADGRILIGGSTDARLAVIGPETNTQGRFVSATLDAGTVAEWGRLRSDADVPRGARLTLRARAGNTATPDETWSPWKEVEATEPHDGQPAGAPAARWLQVEMTLEASRAGQGPVVRSLEIFYQPRNRPPRVETLEVGPPGEAWSRLPQQSSFGRGPVVADDPVAQRVAGGFLPHGGRSPIRKSYEAGARTFHWSAEDPDGDDLVYSLELRREGDEDWLPLAEGVEDEFYSWDSRPLPDGQYRVRLTAKDGRANAPGRGFTAQRMSAPFPVDNTRPTIASLDVRAASGGYTVSFEARDPGGRIDTAEFALEDGVWRMLEPLDGVADSTLETYRFPISPEEASGGDGNLRLRVTDAAGNVTGTSRVLGSGRE